MFEAAADCSSCRTGFAEGVIGVSELSVSKENRNSGCCDAGRSWESFRLCFQPVQGEKGRRMDRDREGWALQSCSWALE